MKTDGASASQPGGSDEALLAALGVHSCLHNEFLDGAGSRALAARKDNMALVKAAREYLGEHEIHGEGEQAQILSRAAEHRALRDMAGAKKHWRPWLFEDAASSTPCDSVGSAVVGDVVRRTHTQRPATEERETAAATDGAEPAPGLNAFVTVGRIVRKTEQAVTFEVLWVELVRGEPARLPEFYEVMRIRPEVFFEPSADARKAKFQICIRTRETLVLLRQLRYARPAPRAAPQTPAEADDLRFAKAVDVITRLPGSLFRRVVKHTGHMGF